jgi:hypothetical protein
VCLYLTLQARWLRKEKGHQGSNSAALRAARAQSTQRPRPSADSSSITGQATAAASSAAAAAALAGRSQSAPGKRPNEQGSSGAAAAAAAAIEQHYVSSSSSSNNSSTAVNGAVHRPGHAHHRHSIGAVATGTATAAAASTTAGQSTDANGCPWGEGSQGIAAAAAHDRKTLVGGGWDLGPGTRISVEQLFGPGAGVWGGGTATSPVDAADNSGATVGVGARAAVAAPSAVSSAAVDSSAAAAVRAPVAAVGVDAVTLTLLSNASSSQPAADNSTSVAAASGSSHDCGLFGQFVFDVDDIMAAMKL